MKIKTEVITAALWPALEKLFGPNGACGCCGWTQVEVCPPGCDRDGRFPSY